MARQTPSGAPSKAERLRLITNLMTGNRWVTGQTGPELARQWGLSLVTIEKDSAEASRGIRRAVEGDSEIRARILAGVQSCIAQATAKGQIRTAIEGLRLLGDLTDPSKSGIERVAPTAIVWEDLTPAPSCESASTDLSKKPED